MREEEPGYVNRHPSEIDRPKQSQEGARGNVKERRQTQNEGRDARPMYDLHFLVTQWAQGRHLLLKGKEQFVSHLLSCEAGDMKSKWLQRAKSDGPLEQCSTNFMS